MTKTVDAYSSDSLSANGLCGIQYSLDIFGTADREFDAAGKLTYEAYSFNHQFIKISGCHENTTPDFTFADLTNYSEGPKITKHPDGTSTEKTTIGISIYFEDYCGICFNPNNTWIATFTELKSSAGNTGDEAKRLMAVLKIWSDGLPQGMTELSPPGMRRVLREWYRIFDVDSDAGFEIEDPCTMDKRNFCTTS